ncbi:hypothetical protein AMTR_s00010p00263480 [Amborella trichopoda]|uniref:Fungal lipase-type domain-containing protein n=1 Tax=Amborella trichopoda TaxID=13333 RepID=W1NG93_AMBTC|nr:hypothetical protein AMTR_s00010p00263480 [Amborella trichopoda]
MSIGGQFYYLQVHEKYNQGLHIPKPLHLSPPRDHEIPADSPKQDIHERWQEIHGSNHWQGLLNPLHPWLQREIIKYGELAQATYDAFDFDCFSHYCGSCRYSPSRLFQKLGLTRCGYKVTKYLYAMSHVDLPHLLNRSLTGNKWSRDSNWMGYVAVSDDNESQRIGRRDVIVAWRGTVTPLEWVENIQERLESIEQHDVDVKVEHGFLSIFRSKSEATRYNKSSACEQAMREIERVVSFHRERGEGVSLTITGHSLGGALALLNAYEAAISQLDIPIAVFSFAAPRVGNTAFRDRLKHLGAKTLRVVIKQDVVPKMPGIVFNEGMKKFEEITGSLQWMYTHLGEELSLDVSSSPFLKHAWNPIGFHSLETYLHLVDGYSSQNEPFSHAAKRDIALVNKACNMVVDELRIPPCWHQLANKGLVQNSYGRWVHPERDVEDIPCPLGSNLSYT